MIQGKILHKYIFFFRKYQRLFRHPFCYFLVPSFRPCGEIPLFRAPCHVLFETRLPRVPSTRYHSLRMTDTRYHSLSDDGVPSFRPCGGIPLHSCSMSRYSPFKGILRLVCDSLRMTERLVITRSG
jgi:hypothetical protein